MLLSQFPLTFQVTQNKISPLHRIVYDYSRSDWDGLCDDLRYFPCGDILVLLLLLLNFVSGFSLELMYQHKYQVKARTSPWFSAACAAAALACRNHFFRLYQQNKSSESKVKFRQASNCCKRLFKAAKLACATIFDC